MSTKLEVLRWVLIVPSAIFVWYACLILGLFSLPILDYFCPPELIVSGACFAEWHQTAENIFIAFFASLSAVLIVTSSVSLAPYKKKEVDQNTGQPLLKSLLRDFFRSLVFVVSRT